LEYCFSCEEYPCKKYDGADAKDSFITHKNQFTDIEKVKQIGIKAYEDELNAKIEILEELLRNYDDGRRKGAYCLAVNLLDLHEIKTVMSRLADEVEPQAPVKTKAVTAMRLFQAMTDAKGIMLKLRK